MKDLFDVAVVGSGFAGSILARCLALSGCRVALLERDSHPRFALGESSTPLAAIALERLARDYGAPDLLDFASYGRWENNQPEIRRGLKRGFTFYRHRAGEVFRNSSSNDGRLLVAASPDDAIADCHWLRADVDHALVNRAVDAGVEYRDQTEVVGAEFDSRGVRLSTESKTLEAAFVVDATGGSSFLAKHLELDTGQEPASFRSLLVGGHFTGVRPFEAVAREAGADFEPGPYPDDAAAVHHLTDIGWMYVLRFDYGTTSAGFVLDLDAARRERIDLREILGRSEGATILWRLLLDRYPLLARQFERACVVGDLLVEPRLQRRLSRAAGPRWALLPHTYAFFDPLFSTGIAWSLVGVERLAGILRESVPDAHELERYGSLLSLEAEHLEALIRGAYQRFGDFDACCRHALLYFTAASYSEVRQRLTEPTPEVGSWAWDGFLGASDPLLSTWIREAAAAASVESHGQEDLDALAQSIAPRNLAGLADSARKNLYPVDLEELVRKAAVVGLSEEEMRALLPRLRGATEASG